MFKVTISTQNKNEQTGKSAGKRKQLSPARVCLARQLIDREGGASEASFF